MSTKISWTDETWNPIVGCSKVSAGCANCYAETMARRLKGMGLPQYQDAVDEHGWTGIIGIAPREVWEKPLKWRKPRRVFVGSMTDLFHENMPDWFIERVFTEMAVAGRHTFQVLTKRAERMRRNRLGLFARTLPNVWLGVTAENQQTADERIPYLLRTPAAAVRFVSVEPMLGPLKIHRYALGGLITTDPLSQVIIGCESGPKRRPCNIEWVRGLVQQCQSTGVPVFVKQLDIDGRVSHDPTEWPADLRVREYPK